MGLGLSAFYYLKLVGPKNLHQEAAKSHLLEKTSIKGVPRPSPKVCLVFQRKSPLEAFKIQVSSLRVNRSTYPLDIETSYLLYRLES